MFLPITSCKSRQAGQEKVTSVTFSALASIGGCGRDRTSDLFISSLPALILAFLWAREGSNFRPLSYQDSVLPLNYVPKIDAGECSTFSTPFGVGRPTGASALYAHQRVFIGVSHNT